MKNNTLSGQIKELRAQKGFSQERLAQECGLSLRTIQRIENEETTPYGDTLKKLAVGLDSSIEELTDFKKESVDWGLLSVLNFSTLSFVIFPLLGIIVPLGIWILKRKTVTTEWVDEVKKILNFQISWCLVICIICSMPFLNVPLYRFQLIGFGGPELILLTIALLYVINFVFIIMNTLFIINSKKVFYQPALKFVR